jgi:hypothetical protein
VKATHEFYGPMIEQDVIFHGHSPLASEEDYEYYTKAVARGLLMLQDESEAVKLFVHLSLPPKTASDAEIDSLFDALLIHRCAVNEEKDAGGCELLVVRLFLNNEESSSSDCCCGPKTVRSTKKGDLATLRVCELRCRGGMRLQEGVPVDFKNAKP